CTDTVIKASFIGGLPLKAIPNIAKSGYVKDPYYEALERTDLNFSNESIVFTNDIARYTGVETDITYAEGFDATCMEQLGPVLIAGEILMAKYGREIGDTIQLTPENWLKGLKDQYIMTHRSTHSADDLTDEEILALYQDEITRMISFVARTYTIAGVVSTASDAYEDLAYTPGRVDEPYGFYTEVKLDVAEFTLADNFRSDEFRDYGKKTAGGSATDGVTLVMDTSKLENLRNSLRLLETLYPIAVTAALLIGGFLCCLVIVQSSKEAAIMRVQGTTKGKTRAILALEQVLLSIVGLAVGTGGLLVYKGAALSAISGQVYLFTALYFTVILVSAAMCSSLATRRNVLELLQTKE
ncbi:MAG: ABC transporter permease, partial [Clostridiales bacterium]|nr:ABC transporter permease [Clostridiales bacterium]